MSASSVQVCRGARKAPDEPSTSCGGRSDSHGTTAPVLAVAIRTRALGQRGLRGEERLDPSCRRRTEARHCFPPLALDAMWEGSDRKPDWSKTGLAHSFSPKEHANGYA
ncbi:hypothetical protein Bxe_C0839 [Paraburkholderia xenovorans LB400]|uniref:Uncharacterized protein n=1 Tax=Paraburkholderia xenovorans (strain LB400) TaxID=266265 RepID=Q13GR9_PARXL|nr:hypothetical protein Bxe_C0839 [Paraburkholderia xenovorans LB400]